MKKIISYLFFLCFLVSYSQEEASNWYFGNNAGIRFNPDGTITALSDGRLSTDEGCTSISDNNGDLLFYTDGSVVFDRFHNIMPNGNGLLGSQSSTQSAIIIPKPQDLNIYYIFTVDTGSFDGTDFGFKYSEVDMTLNGGLGNVTIKNFPLLDDSSEKISAVLKDCQTQAIWVITYASEFGTSSNAFDTFHAYEVTSIGVNTTAVKSSFPTTASDQRGYLKFSPDGTKLACANVQSGMFLYDFDVTTGMVSNELPLQIQTNANRPYGVEFSSNSELLYISSSNDYFNQTNPAQNNNPENHQSSLVQFNLTVADIQSSHSVIDERQNYRSALQLGPDGRIYRSTSETYNGGLPFLSIINNPNEIGAASNYVHNQIALTNDSRQGLPPFIASFFTEKIDIINDPDITTTNLPLCEGESYTLSAQNVPGAVYTWTFNGTPIATPTIPYELEIFLNGLYQVLIEVNTADCETFEGEAFVQYSPFPIANQPSKLNVCDDDNNDVSSFDLTLRDLEVLGTQDPLEYSVHYFRNNADAEANTNEIIGLFDNTSNPQEIFVRIQNRANENCYKTTDAISNLPIKFLIETYNTPTANSIDSLVICDDLTDGDNTNGQTTYNLEDLNRTLLNNQNDFDYTITYHDSQADADMNNAAFSYMHYTGTSEIFVRIENNLNQECFDTTSFTLTINPGPERFPYNLVQCDEDGIPDGFTTFNLTQAHDALTNSDSNLTTTFYRNTFEAENEIFPLNENSFDNWENPQIIYVQVYNTTTMCSSITELTLSVNTLNDLDVSLPEVCDDDGTEDGLHVFNLTETETIVSALLPTNPVISYYEVYEDSLLEQNQITSPNSYMSTNPYTQMVYMRVETQDNECFGISEILLTVYPLPQLLEDETVFYCLNTFPNTITLQSGLIDDNENDYFYSWSSGEDTIDIQVNEPGTYSVLVTNTLGCTKTRTIIVEASDSATFAQPAFTITDTVATHNNTVIVNVTGEGTYEYALYNQDGVYADFQSSATFENVFPGIYTVFVKDTKNDCGTVEKMVSVIGFPKFFSPNGDNTNETWQVYGVSNQFQPNTKIQIFNRAGKLVAQITPLIGGWDGNYNGNPLPSTDYWFAVTLQDGRMFKDHFSLLR